MKLEEHYFTLYQSWGPGSKKVFISEVAQKLKCSDRHAKSIVKQMKEKNWIEWIPNPGRGKATSLTFLLKPNEIEEQQVQTWIHNGDIPQALKWMESQKELGASFVEWLEGQFNWTPSHQQEDGLDTLSYPYYQPIHTLVPCYISTRHEGHLVEHVYNRLITYSHYDKTFHPEIAHHWDSEDNGRIWRFYIRKGVLFHDGSPLTSKTVKENILFWKDHQRDGWKLDILNDIKKINIVSTTIIEIHLNSPNQMLLHLFTDHKAMMIPVHLYEKDKERFRKHPIGTGPYEITRHRNGHMVLKAFTHYFGYRPLLDKVELYSIPNSPLPPRRQVHYRIVGKHTTDIKHYDWFPPRLGGVYLVVNHQKEGLHKHPDFRKMLSHAIDRSKLFQNHPYHAVWFPDSFIDENAGILRQHANVQEAKAWFHANGLKGKTLTLTSTCLEHNAYFGFELGVFKEVFKEMGITLETNYVDINELHKKEHMEKTDIIIAGVGLGENPLVSMLNAITSETSYICNTMPPEAKVHLDSLITTVRQSPDTQTAYENLRNIENFLLDNYYVIFLYQRKIHINVEADERLQGIEINRYNRLNYHKLWYK
ncbi:MarR-like DNA-binding transcriptional regulator SgrR of sgrS sRNA [Evansella vedderi]|uniref:MarR-like DNA-binding transcriptional regulator SgrR of sgrS sRNA n=1 Tax=Evansella vedderi TaxID=38282 RepID=A0ABT9ZYJ4_9BACI|nr:ABC transporter substrate-binding protein [Evansella vedderi]MDQ0256321.1 MarR-like DNA-binding transcriptional regulator SgrR of sgrS sRNA [Evansella vedderi]